MGPPPLLMLTVEAVPMKMFPAVLFVSLLLPQAFGAQDAAPAAEKSQEKPAAEAPAQIYVIVTADRAAVRTLPDKNGPSVMTPEVGQLLQVTGAKRAAFLPVVAPGGYPVWIFGRNLKATDEEGVLEVTANAVNQRPLPSSENKSYPLSRRLHGGDRVRVIGRADETKPMNEDWVQVWSSADSVGWILQSDCSEVKKDGANMWAEAMESFGSRTALEKGSTNPGAKITEDGQDAAVAVAVPAGAAAAARKELNTADELLAAERAKPAPDFTVVKAAYKKVLDKSAGAEIDSRANAGLHLVEALEEAKALESDLEAAKQRRIEDVLSRQKRLWEESRQRDPMIGKYDARGVLERQGRAGEKIRYVLRWGPELVCEVRCASGRYDLDLFAGYELGLKGMLSYSEPDALLADRPVLEVGRIEVLSRR